MNDIVFYLHGNTAALQNAHKNLYDRGMHFSAVPTSQVTHLLLPIPSLDSGGQIKGGGNLPKLLSQLPDHVTVIGGNLQQADLQGRKAIDLLQDSQYLAQNAALTADCAIRIAGSNLPVTFSHCPILVIGWGRIGKCLAAQLKAMGADVTVAARKEPDRATALSLGFHTRDTGKLNFGLTGYRVIFNTVPAPILTANQLTHLSPGCVMIDLASQQGILGDGVIWARGLPSRDVPESSGALIANTILRLIAEKEVSL